MGCFKQNEERFNHKEICFAKLKKTNLMNYKLNMTFNDNGCKIDITANLSL